MTIAGVWSDLKANIPIFCLKILLVWHGFGGFVGIFCLTCVCLCCAWGEHSRNILLPSCVLFLVDGAALTLTGFYLSFGRFSCLCAYGVWLAILADRLPCKLAPTYCLLVETETCIIMNWTLVCYVTLVIVGLMLHCGLTGGKILRSTSFSLFQTQHILFQFKPSFAFLGIDRVGRCAQVERKGILSRFFSSLPWEHASFQYAHEFVLWFCVVLPFRRTWYPGISCSSFLFQESDLWWCLVLLWHIV